MMVERKQFKTRLCAQYQNGRCSRSDCSFAHGNAELRRFSGSYRGTRDYPGSDLRDKLGRRHSPMQGRDARGRNILRDYGSSTPLNRPDDRKQRKIHQADRQRDFSGSFRVSDRSEEVREGKFTPSTSRVVPEEQLKKVLSDITMADDHLHRVLGRLDEKMQETEILTSRIKELESQLYEEKEECKRITTKIKKFGKAHNHYTRAQDELKRSNARLQKMGDHLGSDMSRNGANVEDYSVNIMSDGETTGHHLKGTSPSKKRLHINQAGAEESKQAAILTKGHPEEAVGLTRFSRWNMHPQSAFDNRVEAVENGTYGPMANGSKHKRGRTHSTSVSPAHKLLIRGVELGVIVPSTSMAAHAVDEEVDIESEDKIEDHETASRRNKKEPKRESIDLLLPPPPPLPLHLPPPPPIPPTHHRQGGGKKASMEELGEESVHVDIV